MPRRTVPVRRAAPYAMILALALPATARADLGTAQTALAAGEYTDAEAQLRAIRGASRPRAELLLGRLLLETGRYEDARQIGERLGRAGAVRAEGLTLEGEALAAVGRYDDARQRWERALSPTRPNVARRARALSCMWLARLGRFDEAADRAQPLSDEYNDAMQALEDHPETPGHPNPHGAMLHDAEALTYLGMAARTLNRFQDANTAFNDATRADPRRVEALVESAELYLSKEDMGNAGDALRDALAVNPHDARALALRARTRLMSDLDFAHALADLDAAEAINPNLPDTMVLRAQVVLRDGDIAGADRLVDRALAINPRHLEATAMRGVIRWVANDDEGFRRAFDATFAISPVYVQAYALLGDFADWEHRYDEAATVMRAALERPGIAANRRIQGEIRAQLGMNLLRTGAEADALEQLNASFDVDRYNVRVFNLLNLYQRTIAPDYSSASSGPFVIRYANRERAVMSRYAPQLLQRAYDDMVARYHFTPQGPIGVEMYASNEAFSVRTAGLPEIGVQGVCFGKVITALSPQGGPFNWGQILWHELGHVFAIQLSHSRVPRWFTEGLSEWEAFHSHPEWAREDDASLYRAMRADRVPHVADFNSAFTHARSGGDMMVAYYAASKLVEFMIDRYGFDRVAALLPLWGRGLTSVDVIHQGLGVTAEELDRQFRDATLQRLARYQGQFNINEPEFADRAALEREALAHSTDADAQARSAVAEILAGNADAARARAQSAIAANPSQPMAHWVMARLALAAHDGANALAQIDAMVAAHQDGFDVRVLEARAARLAHDDNRVRTALEAATRQDPTQSDAWEALAEIYTHANRADDALAALRQVVRLDQHDRPALRQLLDVLVARGAWADIRALTEHARNLDPEQATTHVALARAAAETGARADAIYEYESALLLSPANASVHAALGAQYFAAGDRARAEQQARAALQLDRGNVDAQRLLQQLGAH